MFSFFYSIFSLYNTNTLNHLPFLFICLLFRRYSLSFYNLLSCHTASRVCHCQSHSSYQSANVVYGISQALGYFFDVSLKLLRQTTVYNWTIPNDMFSPTQTIHPSIEVIQLSVYLVSV